MATQGLARLLPLLDAASNDDHETAPTAPELLPPHLLPRLETALAKTLQKPPDAQTRADDGLLGSPHLALTVASLPALARAAADGKEVFRSREFVAAVAARVGEREKGMQKWEREMAAEGVNALLKAPKPRS